MAKNKTAAKGGSEVEKGVFRSLFTKGLKILGDFFRNSFIIQFLTGYDEIESYASDSLIVRSIRNVYHKIREKITRKPHRELGTEQLNQKEIGIFVPSTLPRSIKTRISSATENSVVLQKARQLLHSSLYVSMMSYGVFFFSFGLFTTVMQALLYFLLRPSDAAALDLFVGLALVLISLPIMFKGYEPMLESFRDSVSGNLVLRALRSTTEQTIPDKVYKPTFFLFIAGMVGGLLTYFAPPLVLLMIIAIIITALCVLYVPEAGACLILFLLPLFSKFSHPSLFCAIVIVYTGLCFLLKVLVGKRSVSFGLMDGIILLFAFVVLSTGINTDPKSTNSALLYFAMVSGYFVLANLLRSPSWIRRCLFVWSVSSIVVSITGIAECIWDFGGGVALLTDPAVATCYLLSVIPIVISNHLQAQKGTVRFGYFLILIADIVCLVMQGSVLGIIALAVELFFFFVFYTRKIWITLLLLLLSLPFVSYFVWPQMSTVLDAIRSFGNGELWRAMWGVYQKAPLSGIGMNDELLSHVIASETVVSLSQSNTWLRLLVQIGIPGLAIFLLVLLSWYVAGFTLVRKYGTKMWASCQYMAILSAVTALLFAGNFSYIWSDNRLLLLFWMSAGIARALQRIAKRSEEAIPKSISERRDDGVICVDQDFVFNLEQPAETEFFGKDDVSS